MCGIAGWFTSEQIRQDRDVPGINRMINAISHRGPDGKGTLLKDHAVLGHTRLAIIDLDSGDQPMTYMDSNVHIIFNGEIYNYKELKQELEKENFAFRTHSDTEVILAMYIKHGLDAFQYLRGMFAIAIWDGNENRGILVRDEAGIKPLFYKVGPDSQIIFASEAKAILAHSEKAGEIDADSLHLLMNFRYLPGNRSLFKNIFQVEPGTFMQWNTRGNITTGKFKFQSVDHTLDTLEIMEQSVALHLVSDVEVGSYLSGGIDSGGICALAARYMKQPMRTFTLNIGDDPAEANNATRTAELLKLKNSQADIRVNIDELLPKLIWHLEVPKVNSLQVYEIACLASKDVKVVLSGLGGDELFLGYNMHRIIYQANRFSGIFSRKLRQKISTVGIALSGLLPSPVWSERERAIRMFGEIGNWPVFYGILRNIWDTPELRKTIYGPRMLDTDLTDTYEYISGNWPEDRHPVAAAAEFEWKNKLVNDLLWQEDRCSMSKGLEVRVPFLDPVLSGHVHNKDLDELMPRGHIKGYMRKLLSDVLPAEIMNRSKSGFQLNSPDFFNTHMQLLAEKYLCRTKVLEYGLFNPDFIEQIMAYKISKYHRWHYFMLYLMLMTHLWLEIFESDYKVQWTEKS